MTFLPDYNYSQTLQLTVLIALYGFFLVGLLDAYIMGRRITAKLKAKFGEVEKGVRWYAGVRAFQFRPLRVPKPRVARGAQID